MKHFLNPKSIAIIGASDSPGKVGHSLMENLLKFKGKIIPINLNKDSIFGIKAYKKIRDYPEKIELAVIAIPAPYVASELEECGKKRVKNVIVISAGFSETGDSKGEKQLIEICKKYNIKMLGPNCFGVANPYNDLNATFAMSSTKKGNIAFISQSGALWSYISDFSIGKFGFSGFVSLGNMACIDFSDFINYFSKDPKTKTIILYVEKLKEGKRFIEVCKKSKKKIFAVKAGSSKEGSEAAISHTGSLATDFEIYKGAFKQSGVILCESLIQCFEKALKRKLVSNRKKIKLAEKVSIITNAGGAGALASDYLANKKIKVSAPIDLLGAALANDYKEAINKTNGAIIVILTPQKMSEIDKTAEVIIKSRKKIIACFLGGKSVEKACKLLEKNKIPCFRTLEQFRNSIQLNE